MPPLQMRYAIGSLAWYATRPHRPVRAVQGPRTMTARTFFPGTCQRPFLDHHSRKRLRRRRFHEDARWCYPDHWNALRLRKPALAIKGMSDPRLARYRIIAPQAHAVNDADDLVPRVRPYRFGNLSGALTSHPKTLDLRPSLLGPTTIREMNG